MQSLESLSTSLGPQQGTSKRAALVKHSCIAIGAVLLVVVIIGMLPTSGDPNSIQPGSVQAQRQGYKKSTAETAWDAEFKMLHVIQLNRHGANARCHAAL